jgi:hypothetical protein
LCKETLRKIKLKWIGLKFNPPLLLHPTPTRELDEEKERKYWKEVEKKQDTMAGVPSHNLWLMILDEIAGNIKMS